MGTERNITGPDLERVQQNSEDERGEPRTLTGCPDARANVFHI